jgi:hypothetical protein
MYRVDLAGVIHVVAHIPRGPFAERFAANEDRRGKRGDWSHWTPMCQPNEDWLILKDSASNGPSTCFWCLAGERFK